MRVIVAYESMYGNTHQIASAIASGFDSTDDVSVVPVRDLGADHGADVLVVGMPTHAHGLPRPASRRTAIEGAHTATGDLPVDPDAEGSGVREWLRSNPDCGAGSVAAFDTRFRTPAWLGGHPARRVLRHLTKAGAHRLAGAESFYVDKTEHLRPGELERAKQWGSNLREYAIR
jgi:hypothetical protein